MNNNDNKSNIWLKSSEQKLAALIADEAKGAAMLNDVSNTVRQLKAKSSFRIAIINQMIEDGESKND
jgi:riboflavin synthase alpha subunit